MTAQLFQGGDGGPRTTLGIHAKSIHTARRKTDAGTRRSGLQRRHQLLRTSQAILYRDGVAPKSQHRTVWCHRHVVTEDAMPVFRQLDGSRARLGKVKTCGSVWACPVCAAKVAETRRQELAEAMIKHTHPANAGPVQPGDKRPTGYAYLLTFTFPHYIGQSLHDLMEPFTKARQSFQNCRSWKAVMEKANKIGVVNSLEVTYGASNGWHPHLHMLVFCDAGAFEEGEPSEDGRLSSPAIDHLRGEWVRLLEKKGLVHAGNRSWANQFALDVRGGEKAAEYIAKWGHDESWGMSSELTSSHAKTGKRDTWGANDHYTPFQLLAMARDGDGHAICAFREFVAEFDGKRMLTWSRGLKDHFGLRDDDDEVVAAEQELPLNDEHQVGEIEAEQLQILTKFGKLGDFLAFVAEHGHLSEPQQLIDEWIAAVAASGGRAGRGNVLVDRMVVGPHSYWFEAEELAA